MKRAICAYVLGAVAQGVFLAPVALAPIAMAPVALAKPVSRDVAPVETARGYAAALARLGAPPPAFPHAIPRRGGPLYAHADPESGMISFDATASCGGAQYCAYGSFMRRAETPGTFPEILKDMRGRVLTRRVGPNLWFTPEHAMGDTFPAQIQWRDGGVTYTVAWRGLPQDRAETILAEVYRSRP
ncbi:hypothetical protein [Acidomonas methanolica]|uniref:Uncharacterized protein n=3 Tax=Acidomonas methanolica TaxID=437 RepID=A0A023D9R3_ACIMT|nr:hypothetical protein [Acidomonas methanolica]MBU2652920.1 hypothetical protein [Acidomonas methanolica]TCS31323.1 hypothetical protein EDC31_103166 [Acidomonas methanolica]GAJ30445.1 hypothetical protein Amme_136_023 [Acidomonas methanolica NBRC 104435]GEK98428.1 hypothetical protein AME01nite_09270 [Acidomonas methanolica NBRC 104435]